MKTVYLCPLCGEAIPEVETPPTAYPKDAEPGVGPTQWVRETVAARTQANEAMLTAHLELNHTMLQALVALGHANERIASLTAEVRALKGTLAATEAAVREYRDGGPVI